MADPTKALLALGLTPPLQAGACALVALALVAGVLGSGCGKKAKLAKSGIQFHRCVMDPLPELSQFASGQCGRFEVTESKLSPKPRRLSLPVVVLPAKVPTKDAFPVVYLAGGPGQRATQMAGLLSPLLAQINRRHDLVFVDQRGTEPGSPLSCKPPPADGADLLGTKDPQRHHFLYQCAKKAAVPQGAYSTAQAAMDLEKLRTALGAPKIALLGQSYGTRLALEYGARYPNHTAALVLDGVAPRSMKLPLYAAQDAERAFSGVLADCANDPACKGRYPKLGEHFQALRKRLAKEPLRLLVDTPKGLGRQTAPLEEKGLLALVRGALYSRETAQLLPYAIESAYQGKTEALAGLLAALASATEAISGLLHAEILCHEDWMDVTPEDRNGAKSGWGGFLMAEVDKLCGGLPGGRYKHPAPAMDKLKGSLKVPTLLLSGAFDPVTPPRWANLAKKRLGHATHHVVPRHGHGALTAPCVPSLIGEFLKSPQKAPDLRLSGCVKEPASPDYFLSVFGPYAAAKGPRR